MNDEKIVIWKAKAVMPADRFFAIPGHVVALNKANNSVMVACTDGLLEVQEIEKNGEVMAPTALIKVYGCDLNKRVWKGITINWSPLSYHF